MVLVLVCRKSGVATRGGNIMELISAYKRQRHWSLDAYGCIHVFPLSIYRLDRHMFELPGYVSQSLMHRLPIFGGGK